MKKIIALCLCIIVSIDFLYAQFVPKELNFLNIHENWKYLAKDTNFIKSPKDNRSTPYSGRNPWHIGLFDNDLLILESVIGQTPWRGTEGCLIHNLKVQNGQINWIYHNNTYVGNTHREEYGYSDIRKNINGNFEIVGLRGVEPLDTSRFYLGFYGTPIRRVINNDDGTTLSVNYSKDTTKFDQNYFGYGNITIVNSKRIPRRVAWNYSFKDSTLFDKIEFCNINDEMKTVLPCEDSIMHSTELKTSDISLFYVPQLRKLTMDTMVILFGTKNPVEGESTISKMEVYYVDHSDGIKIVKKVDVTNDIYHPQGGWDGDIVFKTIDENLFLAQQINFISDSSFIWLNWYDKNGNLLNKIDKLKYGDIRYRNFYFLGVKDGILYIAAVHNDIETEGFDILRIYPGNSEIEKCGYLARKKEELLEYRISCSKFLPDNKIMIGFWANEKIDGKDFNFQYYYCFNTKDLGITTKTEDINLLSKNIKIYPNPANDYILLSCENAEAAYVEMIDQLGRIISQEKAFECEEKSIDISGLKPGLYFIRLTNNSGRVVGSGKFVKE
jgi:hypothetical protein